MLVLLAFGLIHAYLFWIGDILILYSVLGMVLLLFRKMRPRTLLIWALCLLVPIVLNAALFGLRRRARSPGGAAMMDQMFAEQWRTTRPLAAQTDRVYATGDFVAITRQRAATWSSCSAPGPSWPSTSWPRCSWASTRASGTSSPTSQATCPSSAGGWSGDWSSASSATCSTSASANLEPLPAHPGWCCRYRGRPSARRHWPFLHGRLTLLAERPRGGAGLAPLAYVGRMALTNYLLQTLICTTLFYGYGFGLYGRSGLGRHPLTLAIYAVELAWSAWWLRRFRFGPMEWLWRTLTYGRRQPMAVDLG